MTVATLPRMADPAAPGRVFANDAGAWRLAALAMLPVRIMQGFIYWGGGSRRFIYAPSKLDAWGGHGWMANKFQTAMPGALFGTDHLIGYMLQHFWLLYAGVILFSAAELVAGLALMAGLMTRLSALVTMGFSVLLMAMFGWQGATCIDEWTMAACNLAMGGVLLLAGSGAYSLDNMLLARRPQLAAKAWFRWAGGSLALPLSDRGFLRLAMATLVAIVVFNVGTYSHYRGSVFTPFHGGPVSPSVHHYALSDAVLLPGGGVRFHAYLNGGTPEAPSHIMQAELLAEDGSVVARWNAQALAALPKTALQNDFAYNQFARGRFGLTVELGAMATILLPAAPVANATAPAATLRLTTVNNRQFIARLAAPAPGG